MPRCPPTSPPAWTPGTTLSPRYWLGADAGARLASRASEVRMPASQAAATVVAGVRVSHPDRLIYPELGVSKAQLARYYEEVGPWIVPHVTGRPLTLVHCPEGVASECRYLRHAKAWGPSALERVKIRERRRSASTWWPARCRRWFRW